MIGQFTGSKRRMRDARGSLRISSLGALLVLGGSGGASAAGGNVTGAVKLLGKAPEMAPLNMKSDPFCAKQQAGRDEEVVVGKGGELKNVVVRIAKGVNKPSPAPADPAVVDQTGCLYSPRVVVAQAGQPVEIRNSDMTMHNVHTYKGTATLFNLAHIQGTPPHKKKFATVGDVIKFKCDVHPWMTGYVLVTDNPFFKVTGADGKFDLTGVPAGAYTVEAWHERFGTVTKDIKVAEGRPVDLKFEFKAK